ncbi:MAG TPA: hypothetical protein VKB41_04270 [Steroidobacteraceae bacterium]|nr:hypothetical protein [Steroidobacteraceae bacterium]
MAQYVPDVTQADVERIVGRDYPPELHAAIRELIRGIEVREKTRVVLACLKNAQGDAEKLAGELAEAAGYYREIIGEAEYPNYMRKAFRIDRLSAEERERIIEKDKTQYLRWLRKGEGATGPAPESAAD